jgi:hypothetical protein
MRAAIAQTGKNLVRFRGRLFDGVVKIGERRLDLAHVAEEGRHPPDADTKGPLKNDVFREEVMSDRKIPRVPKFLVVAADEPVMKVCLQR